MSYARFGWNGSSVYVYLSDGALVCCGCWLSQSSRSFYTTAEMVAHLNEHRAVGHVVPDETFTELEAEREENDAWIAEERS